RRKAISIRTLAISFSLNWHIWREVCVVDPDAVTVPLIMSTVAPHRRRLKEGMEEHCLHQYDLFPLLIISSKY
ncbi:hypothetical protein AHF37_11697, partial [Paragonimus kellicotti]